MKYTVNIKSIIICLILLTSCENEKILKADGTFESDYISTLKENMDFIGSVQSFNFVNKDTIVVSSTNPSNLYLYSINGNQIKKFGTKGNGPEEYSNPAIVRTFNEKIYLWDADNLKLIVYDKNGIVIDEYTNFEVAIKDFIPNRNFIYFYYAGGYPSLVGVYDLSTGRHSYRGGQISEEHVMLNINNCSGGMILNNNSLIFSSADLLSLNILDLNNFEIFDKNIIDEDFKVEVIENAKHTINNSQDKMMDYLMNNSFIKGLYKTRENIIIHAETGYYYTNEDKTINNSKRNNKFYIFNRNDLKLKNVAMTKHEFSQSCLYTTFNDELYILKEKEGTNSFNYELQKLFFERY